MKKNVSPKLTAVSIIIFSIIIHASVLSASSPTRILVTPFKNSGAAEYSWISSGITDTVIADLGKLKSISVISNNDRKNAMNEIALGQTGLLDEKSIIKTALITGADTAITGSYSVSGKKLKIKARLINAKTGKDIKSADLNGTMDEIFNLQDRIVASLLSEKKAADNKKYKPSLKAYELYCRGQELQESDPHQALSLFKEAIKEDGSYADAYMAAGFTSGNILSDYNESLNYMNSAVSILEKRNESDTQQYAKILGTMGVIKENMGYSDQALSYYTRAMAVLEKLDMKNSDPYASILLNTAGIYWNRRDAASVISYTDRARAIFNSLSLQNTTKYAVLEMNTGLLYSLTGNSSRALEYYNKSRGIYDRLGMQNTSGYASLMNKTGSLYDDMKKPDTALEYYFKAKSILESSSMQNTEEYADLMNKIGIANRHTGKKEESLRYYNISKSVYEKNGLIRLVGYADILYNIAIYYAETGNKPLAGQYFRKAHECYVTAGYTGELRELSRQHAESFGY